MIFYIFNLKKTKIKKDERDIKLRNIYFENIKLSIMSTWDKILSKMVHQSKELTITALLRHI